jgi:alkaline phosphatase
MLYLGAKRDNSDSIKDAVSKMYGITDLTSTELSAIVTSKPGKMEYILGPIMSSRTDISWTTSGHTGSDVPLYYYGLKKHLNTIENTEIATICSQAMNFDLATVSDSLFQNADSLFKGFKTTIDTTGLLNGGGSFSVVHKGKIIRFPFNRNEVIINGKIFLMNGLTIYSYNNNSVYVPKEALSITLSR